MKGRFFYFFLFSLIIIFITYIFLVAFLNKIFILFLKKILFNLLFLQKIDMKFTYQ